MQRLAARIFWAIRWRLRGVLVLIEVVLPYYYLLSVDDVDTVLWLAESLSVEIVEYVSHIFHLSSYFTNAGSATGHSHTDTLGEGGLAIVHRYLAIAHA